MCGRYMVFKMTYSCGQPYIYYDCECGYSTKEENYYFDDKTTITKSTMSDHISSFFKPNSR